MKQSDWINDGSKQTDQNNALPDTWTSSSASKSSGWPSSASGSEAAEVPPSGLSSSQGQLVPPSQGQPAVPQMPASAATQWDNAINTTTSSKSQVTGDVSATSSVSGDSSTQPRTRQDIISQVCCTLILVKGGVSAQRWSLPRSFSIYRR